ncbi:MAG: peptidase [Gemmatimonadota bacterium]|nr:MAG: peptidase [Gemmatimonadota bacterium]
MSKRIAIELLLLALLGLMVGVAPLWAQYKADVKHITGQLKKLAPVTISYDESILSAEEKKVIAKLVEASRIMDEIFLHQVYSKNMKIRDELATSKDPSDSKVLEYFTIMFGPFDRLDEDKPFLGTETKPLGANYYPEDITKEEFNQWLEDHPEDREAFEGTFTVIKRRGNKLAAVPYSEEYRKWLEPAAKILKEAAQITSDASLKKYLNSRAEAFLSNDYYQSDIDWMDLKGSIEVVIGPYEVYEDNLFGYKGAFESFVTVVDPVESERLATVANYLNDMERNLPIPDEHKNPNRGASSPVKVVQEIFTGGDTKAGIQTTAFNLPNDERVREAKGSKKVMLKNVSQAKFNNSWIPIADVVLDPEQRQEASFDAYFTHVLLHEFSHGLGPGNITLTDGTQTTVNKALQDTYSTMEEAKADVLGNYNFQFLMDKGVYPKDWERTVYISYLGGMFRSIRFGINSAHGRANMIQFNYLLNKGAFLYDEGTGRFSVDFKKIKNVVRDLAQELLMIQAQGDYEGAKRFIDTYGNMTPVMEATLARLSHVPIDIKPIYAIAQ